MVFRGVLVLRRVAAADVAALEAEAEVDPAVAHLQALFAAIRRIGFALVLVGGDRFEMFAGHGMDIVMAKGEGKKGEVGG